jgi:hypothetical protein
MIEIGEGPRLGNGSLGLDHGIYIQCADLIRPIYLYIYLMISNEGEATYLIIHKSTSQLQ